MAAEKKEEQKLLDEIQSLGSDDDVPARGIKIIRDIAISGGYVHAWPSLVPLLVRRLKEVVDKAHKKVADCPDRPFESFKEKRQQLVDALQAFDEAPFTLQRLCEILLEPHRQYKSTNKLLAGLDKLLSVSSTYGPCEPGDRVVPVDDVGESKDDAAAADESATTAKASLPNSAGDTEDGSNDGVGSSHRKDGST